MGGRSCLSLAPTVSRNPHFLLKLLFAAATLQIRLLTYVTLTAACLLSGMPTLFGPPFDMVAFSSQYRTSECTRHDMTSCVSTTGAQERTPTNTGTSYSVGQLSRNPRDAPTHDLTTSALLCTCTFSSPHDWIALVRTALTLAEHQCSPHTRTRRR